VLSAWRTIAPGVSFVGAANKLKNPKLLHSKRVGPSNRLSRKVTIPPLKMLTSKKRSLIYALTFPIAGLPPLSFGAMTIVKGLATAGADSGASSSMTQPPLAPSSINSFYDFRDVAIQPSYPSGLQAGGWATSNWQIGEGIIIANGSSRQGFSGSFGQNGWIYAWGHASFELTIKFNRAYSYTVVSPTINVPVFSEQSGIIRAGARTITASTYGNSGGFGLNVRLTPLALTPLRYFAVGVNWLNAGERLRGDLDATKLRNQLQASLASYSGSTIVPLDAAASGQDNENTLSQAFNAFLTTVDAGDTVVFLISTHGNVVAGPFGLPKVELAISADKTHSPTTHFLVELLNALPSTSRKIVVLDFCHAGAVGAGIASSVPNTCVLAASSAVGTTGALPDGTGIFTDSIARELDKGVFSVNQIVDEISNNVSGTYPELIGQAVDLKDTGSAIFTGLQPELYERREFDGDISGPDVSPITSAPQPFGLTITEGQVQFGVSNVPAQGAVAIESSEDMVGWLQLSFKPAAGADLSFTYLMGHASRLFFRVKAVPL